MLKGSSEGGRYHTGQRHIDASDDTIAAPWCSSKTKLASFGTLGTHIVTLDPVIM